MVELVLKPVTVDGVQFVSLPALHCPVCCAMQLWYFDGQWLVDEHHHPGCSRVMHEGNRLPVRVEPCPCLT